jgi:hypothetical protein
MSIEKKISILIEEQFPDFYKSDGPLFVDFVQTYYEWMETKSDAREDFICDTKSSVQITHGSANVVGSNTTFINNFANGDKIAICRQTEDFDYELFTIDTVVNNTLIILSDAKLPDFAFSNTRYGTVANTPNPLWYGRRILDINDIDETIDSFLLYFKEKYLKNIQFATVSNTQRLVKNSLDLYRSKGTERSIDLLFKMAFGIPATVYYPSTDLFRTSAGTWKVPKYLELSPNELSVQFVNQQIRGVTSEATAFCESVIRRTVAGKIIDIAYISAINGAFITGEKIIRDDNTLDVEECPKMVGSLNALSMSANGIGQNFTIGDIVDIESTFGRQAKGRVANTANNSGTVTLTLEDGGYGYSQNAEVIISEYVLGVANIQPNTSESDFYFRDWETVTQPYANITYSSATDTLSVGDDVFTYYGNGSLDGTGQILEIQATNSTAGEIRISILSGNMESSTFYTTSNAAAATQDTYGDVTATGNVVGIYSNVDIFVTGVSGTFTTGETLLQNSVNVGTFASLSNTFGANGTIRISNANTNVLAIFGNTLTGETSGETATVNSITVFLGVKDTTNTFIATTNNYLVSDTLGVNGTVVSVSSGSGFDFDVSNNFLYEEYININTDYITTNATHYLTIDIDAAQYGLSGDPSGNLTSNTIENILGYQNTKIGKIRNLINFDPGSGYNFAPVIKIKDPWTYLWQERDEDALTITGATSSFSVGEIVTQNATGARSMVLTGSNSTILYVQRLRLLDSNNFVLTTNSTTTITGETSGATANISLIQSNVIAEFIGYDAEISTLLATSNGSITEVEVTDSGFGFVNGEFVTLTEVSNTSNFTNDAIAILSSYGTGSGYYTNKGGHLSGGKKLQDGHYWQRYSYEVRSSITLDKYRDTLKEVVHVAGTAMFGNLIHESVVGGTATATSNNINITGTSAGLLLALTQGQRVGTPVGLLLTLTKD